MKEEDPILRIERFEKTVATCLCALPILFSMQCLLAAFSSPVFANMLKGFGAELPWPTQFVIITWQLWALIAVAVPVAVLKVARKGRATFSIVFSTVAGVAMFFIAQFVTAALFLPIFELGAVAGGLKR